MALFSKKTELMAKIKGLEEKYKDSPSPKLEKGDTTAIIIAAIAVFAPFVLLLFGLIFVISRFAAA